MMRALVIGASGFIGLHVVDALLERGVHVRATRRRSTPTLLLRKRPVELVEASLEEPRKLRAAMEGCDAVVLSGAHYPRYSLDREASLREGVRGVVNACEAAREAGIARFVYTSSIGVLGPSPRGRYADERDVARTMPRGSVYRAVKWAMERAIEEARFRGLDAVSLLAGGCIGAWDLRVGTNGIVAAVTMGALPWWTDGWINLVDVRDVARAHVKALFAGSGSRYCLAGHNLRVEALLKTIASRYGGRVPDECIPHEEAALRAERDERVAAPGRLRVPVPRELVDLVAAGQPVSSERARAELDFQTTPLATALDRAHAWLARFGHIHPVHPADEEAS